MMHYHRKNTILTMLLVGLLVWLPQSSHAAAPSKLTVSPASRTVTLELTIPSGRLTATQIQTLLGGRSVPLSQVLPASVRQFARIIGGSFAAQWSIFIDQEYDNGTPVTSRTVLDSLESASGFYSIDGTLVNQDNIVLAVTGVTNATFPGTVTLNQQITIPKVVLDALLTRLLQIRTGDPAVRFAADGSLKIIRSFLLQYTRTFVLETTVYHPNTTTMYSTTNIGPTSISVTTKNHSRGSLQFAYLDRVSVDAGTVKNLTPGIDIFVPLRWRAYIKGAGGGQLAVNASQLTVKTAGGKVLLTRPGFVLSRGLQRGISINTSTREFRETVNLPASVSRQAQLLGSRYLVFERRITGGGRTLSASVRLPLLSVMSGPLRITREELFFDHNGRQGAYQLIVQKNDELRAIAVINFGGTGHMRGFWEIAGPLASRNEAAIFRPMPMDKRGQGGSLVLRLLSGYPQTRQTSGRLPSGQGGYYRLRFRIATPMPSFRAPQISYYVSNQTASQQSIVPELGSLRSIVLSWPADGAELDPVNPRVAWQATDFSDHYRVEIYAEADVRGPVLAGVVSAKGQTTLALKPVTMARLEAGKTYYWRVVGITMDGIVVAASKLRSMRMP